MKNRCFSVILFLLFCGLSVLGAQSREDFSAVVDFGVDLETLANLAGEGNGFFAGDTPLVILTGSVASRIVLRPGPEDYLSELELVDGRWLGLEAVKTYRCFVQFSGPEYVTFIPARRSRRPPPEEIPLNATILVVGKPAGLRDSGAGKEAIIQGYFVRVLEE